MDQDVQSRVEELEQNVQAKDRELVEKVYCTLLICYDSIVCVCVLRQKVHTLLWVAVYTLFSCFDCRRNSCIPARRSSTIPAAN